MLVPISVQQKLAVQRVANALFDVQVGTETMDLVMDDIAAVGLDGAFNSYYEFAFGSSDPADVAAMITANLNIVEGQFGLTAADVDAAEGLITSLLAAAPVDERGAVVRDLVEVWAGLEGEPTYGAAAAAWNAEIAIALEYEGEDNVAPGTVLASEFFLTANQDMVDGTSGDDTFFADVVQANGPQVNSLGTGDNIDAGTGMDTLWAQVTEGVFAGGGNMPIQPRLDSVDDVRFEALFSSMGLEVDQLNLGALIHEGINLLPGNVPEEVLDALDAVDFTHDTTVYVNMKNAEGTDFIWSYDSDADLIVQDVNTIGDDGSVRNTEALTIGMAYTGNRDHIWNESDFHVYFDQDYLLAGQEVTSSEAYYFLLDQDATEDTLAAEPLLNIDRDGIIFDLDGQTFSIVPGTFDPTADVIDEDNDTIFTHQDYVDELNKELTAMLAAADEVNNFGRLSSITITVEDTNFASDVDETFLDDGTLADVLGIVVRDEAGGEFSNLQYSRTADITGEFNVYGRFSTDPSQQIDQPITINVLLEKAGRGADGGDLVIGGMNKDGDNECGDGSDTTPAGIEQFNVEVSGGADLPSSLASMRSTNNALSIVNVTSINPGTDAAGDDTWAPLAIGNSNTDGPLDIGVTNFHSALKDVVTFDASEFMGDLTLYAGITDETICKTLDLVDTAGYNEDDVDFDYDGGSGDDTISVQIDSDVVAHEDFLFNLSGNDGDDFLTVAIMNGPHNNGTFAPTPNDTQTNWYADMIAQNMEERVIEIDGGAGNDTIWTPGGGNMFIYGGSGDDRIYTDNSANYDNDDLGSTFYLNTVDATETNNLLGEAQTDANNMYRLFGTTLTVSFQGHDVTVALNDTNGRATDMDINQAIKEAINSGPNATTRGEAAPGDEFDGQNDDPGLGGVLSAYDGEGYSLVVESLISGDMNQEEEDLVISLTGPTSLTVTELGQLNSFYGTALDEAGMLALINAEIAAWNAKGDYMPREAFLTHGDQIDADDDFLDNDNWVLPGTGDDLVVLGTNNRDSSNDTVAYEGYNNGFDDIYNFRGGELTECLEYGATIEVLTQGVDAVTETYTNTVPEIFTLEVTGTNLTGTTTATITFTDPDTAATAVVTLTGAMTAEEVRDAFVAVGTFGNYTATAGPTSSTVTMTETGGGAGFDLTNVETEDFDVSHPTISGVLNGVTNDQDGSRDIGTPGVTGVLEVFRVTFGDSMVDTSYTLDGVEIIPVLDGETSLNIAQAAFDADLPGYVAVDAGADGVYDRTSDSCGNYYVDFVATATGTMTDATLDLGAATNVFVTTMAPLPGYDMIDYTDYNATGVYVENQGWIVGGPVANSTFIFMDEEDGDLGEDVNFGEYRVSEVSTDDAVAFDADDVELGMIGVIDFGYDPTFVAENFLI